MSTSSEVYTARINTPVHISLTGLSSTSQRPMCMRPNSVEATTSSRSKLCLKIRPTCSATVRPGSLTLVVHPPVSTMSTGRLCMSLSGQSSIGVGRDRQRWTGGLGLHDNLDTGGVFVKRNAPAPPRLPDYTETELPPPYNPDFLAAPMNCRHWSDVVGRRWSSVSACCPPPPPPSRGSSTTAEVRPRSSVPLMAEQCVVNDDDDDVFFTEK